MSVLDEKRLWRVNCAGRGCAEAEGCRRYRIRLPRLEEGPERPEHKVYEWASWDVERQVFGDCKALVKFRET